MSEITTHTQMAPLQATVLEKYQRLAESLRTLDSAVKELNRNKKDPEQVSAEEVLEEMRDIEVKIGLIGTLLKGSVYSLILQRKNEWKLINKEGQ